MASVSGISVRQFGHVIASDISWLRSGASQIRETHGRIYVVVQIGRYKQPHRTALSSPRLGRGAEAVKTRSTTDLLDALDAGDLRQERRKRISTHNAVSRVDERVEPGPVMDRITR